MNLQSQKAVVRAYHEALDNARPGEVADVLRRFCAENMTWMGMHPWHEIHSLERLATEFWEPLRSALGSLQRRPDIFMAGRQEGYAMPGDWVCEMGHFLGLHDRPWLGIRPTRKMAFLRYCEWSRVEGGRIVDQALYLDLDFVLAQAGACPYARTTGAVVLTPGPRTHDGLMHHPQPPSEGAATLALIDRMVARLVSSMVRTTLEDLAFDWEPGMLWWGPSGIGATYTHGRYLEQHCRPFETGTEFVRHDGHETRIGEGGYGGFFGYPSLILRSPGGYLGAASASDRMAEMRIVDLYRREGDLLAENWIFIDHLHFLNQLGYDVLGRMAAAG
jgi:hypothetical protein